MISSVTLAIIALNIMFAVVVPCGLLLFLRKKFGASITAFLVGCGIWFFFAMILEQILHGLVITSSIGPVIVDNLALNALYGGLAAAVFEEAGRFVGIKLLLKRKHGNPHNALMYGAGHGGFEMLYLFGMSMLSNLTYSLMINDGSITQQIASFSPEEQGQVQALIDTLVGTPSYMFAMGLVERVSAVILHIALSVLVWAAVVNGKKMMFPIAMAVHFVVDASSIILFNLDIPVVLVELVVLGMALVAAYYAKKVFEEVVVVGSPQRY
ncbi:MAG: YhfC family intramembrane metalloprotease [Lachnospiraceae bacterium]|nr:YhfC family intramembrane metalloprotease [Lachnospiraceae bacterium]